MSLRTQSSGGFYEYGIDVPRLKMAEKFLTISTTISFSKRKLPSRFVHRHRSRLAFYK
jgi:hypothetical protein